MSNLFNPPPSFALPLSKYGDLDVTFVYKPLVVDGSGNPILDGNGKYQYAVANYPNGATVSLNIDGLSPIVATITGSQAAVFADHLVVDPVAKNAFWAAVITYANGKDQVMCNGQVTREDGKLT
jgi:hypothetical protein